MSKASVGIACRAALAVTLGFFGVKLQASTALVHLHCGFSFVPEKTRHLVGDAQYTIEEVLPKIQDTLAVKYRQTSEALLKLHREHPSYHRLFSKNEGLRNGTSVRAILLRIKHEASLIGNELTKLSYGFGRRDRDLLLYYAGRFLSVKTMNSEKWNVPYNPREKALKKAVEHYGKASIDSLWSELRVSLRLPGIVAVGMLVKDLVESGYLDNSDGAVDALLEREIDHMWYPKGASVVAIGDTKAFDNLFSENHNYRAHVRKQLKAYLALASVIAEQHGIEAEVHYFFAGGVSSGEKDNLLQLAADFNKEQERRVPAMPIVKLFIHGEQ